MAFTWIKYGKPDVSMCLNASLAGLVAITAPCDVTDCVGAAIIGAVAGILVVFGVWFVDNVLHVDDPVGAVAVHMFNGIWGTIAVGLFATSSAPGFELAGIKEGLFYGGGFKQLGLQFVGMFITAAWTIVTITIVFIVLKDHRSSCFRRGRDHRSGCNRAWTSISIRRICNYGYLWFYNGCQ